MSYCRLKLCLQSDDRTGSGYLGTLIKSIIGGTFGGGGYAVA
jgi:hypothetical protein